MNDTWYFYCQHGKGEWQPKLADDRERVVREEQPDFATVLDINRVWKRGEDKPEGVAYRGPLYFDWDGETIGDVLGSVRVFMRKLESIDFPLEAASWYLSGKKGVHCTLPSACFINESGNKTLNRAGLPDLPTLYRLMAASDALMTDHMDFSVYSLGKGRMWRVENVRRVLDDGRVTYKVPISAAQLRKLDEDAYWEWCSQVRPALKPESPKLNVQLSVEFMMATQTAKDSRAQRKSHKGKTTDFSMWAGRVPPTFQEAFAGRNIRQNLDLNTIKLQLVIAAIAVGFDKFEDEDRFIEAIGGFIESRVGMAGAAHKTHASIEAVMRNCFRAVVQNPAYTYYPEVFATILTPEAGREPDLTGKQVGDENRQARIEQDFKDMTDGTAVDEMGVVEIGKEQVRAISNYSWKPGSLMRIYADNGLVQAYSVTPLISGNEKPRQVIPISIQNSQSKMAQHVMELGGHLETTNGKKFSQVLLAWRQFVGENATEASEAVATPTEGLYCHLLHDPVEKGYKNCMNIYWVSPLRVVPSSSNCHADEDGKYPPEPVYVDPMNPGGRYGIDIAETPYTLQDKRTPLAHTVHSLLELNGNFHSLALLLGWFTACTAKHILYKMGLLKNFPILQVYGDAGCGKTTTMNLMLKLFTWKTEFRVNTAGDGLTQAAMRMMATGSTSIPLVIDEVKAQNLGNTHWMSGFRQLLQNIYTIGGQLRKAGGRGGEGSHHNGMVDDPMYAPVAFMGETLETSQTSLLERIVTAGFHAADKSGRREFADYLQVRSRELGILGWTLIREMMEYDLEKLADLHTATRTESFTTLYSGGNDRRCENAAIVFTGFKLFSETVRKYFPQRFDDKLVSLYDALTDKAKWELRIDSEVVRLLKFLSQASYDDEYSKTRVIRGRHYRFQSEQRSSGVVEYLVVDSDRVYNLYRERMRSLGENAVYTGADEMYHALKNSSLTVDAFSDTELGPRCIKIDPSLMLQEDIRQFKR